MKAKNILIRLIIMFISNNQAIAQSCGTPDVLMFGTIQTTNSSSPYWKPVNGATEYNVRYRERNAGMDYSNPINTTDTMITLTGLTPATNYEFIVQSVCQNQADTSVYSSSGWFTTMNSSAPIQVTRGPFMTVPTSGTMTIQWSTNVSCNSEVKYGTDMNNLSNSAGTIALTTSHVITLTNLLPNTKYFYSVGITGTPLVSSSTTYFYSAPLNNDTVPIKFWVTGDFGTGSSAQTAVRDAFANYSAGQKINGWLWLGDNAYANGSDQEYQTNVFNVYPSQFKNIPVFPVLGNHDYAQSGYLSSAARGTNFAYFSIFNLPITSGTEKYYSANYGNIHFIALDSYGSYNTPGSPMYNWLQNDLMNNTQQWTIVYFHHPPYTKGSHDSDNAVECTDMRQNIIPLLESYGVDLVLSGHSHAYERSYLIKGHYGLSSTFSSSNMVEPGGETFSKATRTGDGTIYVVCGVGGQLEAPSAGFPHNAMYYSSATKLGSLILEVSGGNLSCSFLTSTGAIADHFSVSKPPVSPNTAVNDMTDHKTQFEVYPNPANDEFNIYSNSILDKTQTVRICNQVGQTVFTKTVDVNNNNMILRINKSDIANFAAGMYFVSVIGENSTSTKPLMIE